MVELTFLAGQCADTLYHISGFPVLVCDRDRVVAVAGVSQKEMLERRISPAMEDKLKRRKAFCHKTQERIKPVEGVDLSAVAGAVITDSGDVRGAVMLMERDAESVAGDTEIALVKMTAALIGNQLVES